MDDRLRHLRDADAPFDELFARLADRPTLVLLAGGAGSEIQKPLATVVVGGLVTSTLLTLLIIPSVYSWFEKRKVEEEM